MKELICIICPRGCRLNVDENMKVTGNSCPRGENYAVSELKDPQRMVTATVAIVAMGESRLPVKTSKTISKNKMFEVMDEINKISVKAPIFIGDVIIKDVAGTGADVVATKNIVR